MVDVSALRCELSSALDARASSLPEVLRHRSQTDRVDALCVLMRGILSGSSVCHIDGRLMFFDGRCHVPVSREELLVLIGNLLSARGVGDTDVSRMGRMPLGVLNDKSYVSDVGKVCFSDCVYDLASGESFPFSAEHRVVFRLPYALGVGGCPMWESFLCEVLPDCRMRMCLQEFFGMCFVDRERLSIEKMALFVGSGANGKSVVFEVMKRVLGSGNVSFLSPDQLADYRQIIALEGKVINFAPDVRRGASFDSALKALASSQEVQAWKMYEGNVVLKCPPLVFALNEMPLFRDVTDAFFRRVLLFSFDVVIPVERQDRGLADRICASELSGIFRWIMEGRERLVRNGGRFTECERMVESLSSLKTRVRGETNPVLSYLGSIGYGVIPSYGGQQFDKVGAKTIYDGLGGKVSKTDITREMTALGVRHSRSREVVYYLYKKQ